MADYANPDVVTLLPRLDSMSIGDILALPHPVLSSVLGRCKDDTDTVTAFTNFVDPDPIDGVS